jgi:hypothetical protein
MAATATVITRGWHPTSMDGAHSNSDQTIAVERVPVADAQ